MNNPEQQFLKALDDKLWKSADKLRANLDAANYKHAVLGLIFLKYVSNAFEERQEELLELFKTDNDDNTYYMAREDCDSNVSDELEILDYYREANLFWVPKTARWNTLKEKAVLHLLLELRIRQEEVRHIHLQDGSSHWNVRTIQYYRTSDIHLVYCQGAMHDGRFLLITLLKPDAHNQARKNDIMMAIATQAARFREKH